MKLVIIFLNRIEYLEDLLYAFVEIGVPGATVLDSTGMGHIVSEHIPIFAGLRDAFAGSSPGTKTIVAVVEEEMVEKIAEVVDEICWSAQETKSGFVVSIPVDAVYGFGEGGYKD